MIQSDLLEYVPDPAKEEQEAGLRSSKATKLRREVSQAYEPDLALVMLDRLRSLNLKYPCRQLPIWSVRFFLPATNTMI